MSRRPAARVAAVAAGLGLLWPAGSARAAASKSDKMSVDTAEINEAGVGATSATSGRRQQISLGAAFSAGDLTTTRFRMQPGFFAAAVASNSKVVPPPTPLDVTLLYAKTSAGGVTIDPSSWQDDADPIFIWDAPGGGVDVAGYSYALDGDPDDVIDGLGTSWDVAADPIKTLADGKRTFKVKAINTAGQAGNAASVEIWIDRTPPSLGDYSPSPGSLLNTRTPAISASATDAHSGLSASSVTLLINGGAVAVSVDPATGAIATVGKPSLKEGSNSLELRIADVVGNALAPLVWSVSADVTPPSGTLVINAGAESTTSIHVTLNLTAADATSGVSRMLVSNDPLAGYVEEAFTTVRELWRLTAIRGEQSVYVKFADAAGNVSDPISDDILLALLAPETIIVSGPAGITPQRTATFTYTCPEGGCRFAYSFDGQEWSDWDEAASVTRDDLIFGNHYFAVKAAKEVNGQEGIQPNEEDPVPAERTWIVGVEPTQIFVPRGNPIKLWRLE
jgi:hypothetical protein